MFRFTSVMSSLWEEDPKGRKLAHSSFAVFIWNHPRLHLSENVKVSPASRIAASFLLPLTFHSGALKKVKD